MADLVDMKWFNPGGGKLYHVLPEVASTVTEDFYKIMETTYDKSLRDTDLKCLKEYLEDNATPYYEHY